VIPSDIGHQICMPTELLVEAAWHVHTHALRLTLIRQILTLFLDAKLPGNVRKRMYTEMYYDLTTKHERNVTNFM
jgi:hypothetical protein